MTKPLISFIIPVYKVEAYLRGCIDSIRKQSFENWEMVLVNDGSPDNSGAICDEYAAIDSRIKVKHQENKGVAAARNQGLDTVIGDWIWFVDSDDYIVEGALQKLADTIHRYECDTIFFGLLNDYNGMITPEDDIRNDIFNLPQKEFLKKVFCYTNPTMLFNRSIIQKQHIRFTEGIKMAEDLELQYKYLLFCKRPVQIADNLYVYQHREGSAMTNPQTEKNNMSDCVTVAGNLADFVRKYKIPESLWFSLCVRKLLKGSLQSAERLSSVDIKGVKTNIKAILAQYQEMGYYNVADRTLRIAAFSLHLYFLLLRIYYKKSGKR